MLILKYFLILNFKIFFKVLDIDLFIMKYLKNICMLPCEYFHNNKLCLLNNKFTNKKNKGEILTLYYSCYFKNSDYLI